MRLENEPVATLYPIPSEKQSPSTFTRRGGGRLESQRSFVPSRARHLAAGLKP